jgi:5-methylcytosine-specific restriction endonuclease McrA
MHKQTKACDIPKHVKDVVWERDSHRCCICGSPAAAPCAHFIARSHGGLGIEENIVTLCADCHRAYDQSPAHEWYKSVIRRYLKSKYPGWDERQLVYRKYGGKL